MLKHISVLMQLQEGLVLRVLAGKLQQSLPQLHGAEANPSVCNAAAVAVSVAL